MRELKMDENLSRHMKPHLEPHGHDARTVHDEELLGKLGRELPPAR